MSQVGSSSRVDQTPESESAAPPPRQGWLEMLGLGQPKNPAEKAERAARQAFESQLIDAGISSKDAKLISAHDLVDIHGNHRADAVIKMANELYSPVAHRRSTQARSRLNLLITGLQNSEDRQHIVNIAAVHATVTTDSAKNDAEHALVVAALDSAKTIYDSNTNAKNAVASTILGHFQHKGFRFPTPLLPQLVRDVMWRPNQVFDLYQKLPFVHSNNVDLQNKILSPLQITFLNLNVMKITTGISSVIDTQNRQIANLWELQKQAGAEMAQLAKGDTQAAARIANNLPKRMAFNRVLGDVLYAAGLTSEKIVREVSELSPETVLGILSNTQQTIDLIRQKHSASAAAQSPAALRHRLPMQLRLTNANWISRYGTSNKSCR